MEKLIEELEALCKTNEGSTLSGENTDMVSINDVREIINRAKSRHSSRPEPEASEGLRKELLLFVKGAEYPPAGLWEDGYVTAAFRVNEILGHHPRPSQDMPLADLAKQKGKQIVYLVGDDDPLEDEVCSTPQEARGYLLTLPDVETGG